MTDLEKELASKQWKSGMMVKDIAGMLGITERSFMRMRSRLADLFLSRKKGDREPKQTEEQRRETASANARRMAFHEATKPVILHKPKEQAHQYDQSRLPYAVTLADLSPRGCKFCVTEYPKGKPNLMCNEVRADNNYCSQHLERSRRAA